MGNRGLMLIIPLFHSQLMAYLYHKCSHIRAIILVENMKEALFTPFFHNNSDVSDSHMQFSYTFFANGYLIILYSPYQDSINIHAHNRKWYERFLTSVHIFLILVNIFFVVLNALINLFSPLPFLKW